MGERAEGECVFIRILRFADEIGDEVAGADVVRHVGEELAAEGVVAEILNDRAAVGISVGLLDLVGRDARVAAPEQRDDVGLPGKVDDLLVRQDRIGTRRLRRDEKQCEGECERGATAGRAIEHTG
jgi:hypothetical protein